MLSDHEESPWGAPAIDDNEPSPWGNHSDPEVEEDDEEELQPQINHDDDPYEESPYIDSSQLLGSSTQPQGLQFVSSGQQADREESPVKRSPRRGRHSKIKKTVSEVQSLDNGPLTPVDASPRAAKNEKQPLSRLFESVSLEGPPTAAVEDDEGEEEASTIVAENEPETDLELAGTLKIEVSDPSKVGDITSSHIVYTINTTTDLDTFPEGHLFSVQRRYRDFRWLYKALVSNNAGCVVPPPPEKQVFGTMNGEFVETRRAALETMLVKISRHPLLRTDADLVAFLSHEDFNEYLKSRVISDEELEAVATSGGGFLGLSVFARGEESDNWLNEQRTQLDILELQLRGLAKAFELLHGQRKDLATSLTEFANVTTALASVEPTRKLEAVLRAFARVHTSLSELYLRQRQQDMLFVETTVDEQLRLVGSVRNACNARHRLQVAALSARQEATRQEAALSKLPSGSDRVAQQEEQTKEALERAEQAETAYNTAAERVESELSRVEREKVAEFRNSVELFLENAVESQKHAIELWETFYTRHINVTA